MSTGKLRPFCLRHVVPAKGRNLASRACQSSKIGAGGSETVILCRFCMAGCILTHCPRLPGPAFRRDEAIGSGEHTRPACGARRPAEHLVTLTRLLALIILGDTRFPAGRRKRHAGGVRSPQNEALTAHPPQAHFSPRGQCQDAPLHGGELCEKFLISEFKRF